VPECPKKIIICLVIGPADWISFGGRMDWDDYLRDEARKYRRLAEQAVDPVTKQELLELADICDKVANNIEDRMTAG
jgi:hypothetical protein